jgi:hypothetical protein
MNNDNRTRNFIKELRATTTNLSFPGNQRNVTSRDSKGFNESTDMGQNISFELLNENITVGFGVGGL